MEESYINNLPPGFRFHPTDEELISYYLTQKVSDFSFTSMAIIDVDLNKCEPWDLPAKASMGEKEWYFFNLRDRKYPTGLRTNRATEAGYWKTTGKDKEIFRGGVLVGMKKTLVFYKGRAPRGEKTNWVVHEYRLETNLAFRTTKEEWVVCRVFQKSLAMRKPQDSTPSHPSLDSPCDTNPITNDFGDIDQFPNLNSTSSITHVSLQNCMKLNNMNWPAAPSTTTLPSLSWPHTLFGSNLSMDALLLKAFSLYPDYKPSIMSTHGSSHFPVPSSAKVLDALQQQQQQLPPQEQPFSLDSIW